MESYYTELKFFWHEYTFLSIIFEQILKKFKNISNIYK